MTTLPSQHPTVSLHLTDVTLTPLITSSSSPSHLESLTSLAHSALTSQAAVQRANLGRPQRIMVEYPDRGAVVLQSYLDPHDTAVSSSASAAVEPQPSHVAGDASRQDDAAAPTLIGVVVAGSADDTREARRAASRLERAGRVFQREWVAEDTKSGQLDGST
ncbi:hypothetical protein HJFPF1_01961 [Paramyrothecium foliicola]|nr:hypothetical protein HJFPF1_01961 [Paramyrothecium foliicola]